MKLVQKYPKLYVKIYDFEMRLFSFFNYIDTCVYIKYTTIMGETWLPVTLPGCSAYFVSSQSNIRNSEGIIMSPTRQLNITMSGTEGTVRKYIYEISCLAFHGEKPSTDYSVDHIDRNWKNNDVSNLRWATKAEQMKNRTILPTKGLRVVYKTQGGIISFKSVTAAALKFGIKKTTLFLWLRRDITVKVKGGTLQYDKVTPKRTSIIKEVPYWIRKDDNQSVVKASSCGLILKSGLWSTGSETGRPAKYFSSSIGSKHNYFVHRLVAAAFLGEPDYPDQIYVNHIDGNGFNNNIENLEWVSPAENSQHAADTGLLGCLKPVVQYSLEGKRVQEFPSVSEAARCVHGVHNNIHHACRGKRPSAYNFMWRLKSEAPDSLPPISRGSRRKEVRQYDLDGNLINTFSSGRVAAEALGASPPQITVCCQGKFSLGNFTLKTG